MAISKEYASAVVVMLAGVGLSLVGGALHQHTALGFGVFLILLAVAIAIWAHYQKPATTDTGKPYFALEVREEIHNYDPSDYYFFWITDCGERAARNVTFDPIPSKRAIHHIRLDPQPFVPPLTRTPLTFHCGNPDDMFGILDGNPGRLRLFCEDNPNNEAKLYFPVTIRYLDGDRQLEEHHTLEVTTTDSGPRLKMYPTIRPE